MNEHVSKSLLLHAAVWVVVAAAALFGSYALSGEAYSFLGVHSKPVLINPLLLAIATLLFALLLALTINWTTVSRSRSHIGVFAFAAIAALGVASALVSMRPGKGSWVLRETIPVAAHPIRPDAFGIPIFFENDSVTLDRDAQRQLNLALAVFRDCHTSGVVIRGFSSSARFPRDSDRLNTALANRRAQVVSGYLRPDVAITKMWDNHSEMLEHRRIVDERDGERIRGSESLNRRVEVLWQQSPCVSLPTLVATATQPN